MTTEIINENLKIIKADEGKYLHNTKTDLYCSVIYIKKELELSYIEEVNNIPEIE